ncbi:response regulator transcription factor [Actinoplanes sp. NPDC026670]|uniref:response regulator transcription factor n=1 Tax=Actinoplanes sp. NPDC026670 TaxID=3154700 RepID=UPI0033F8B882
MRVLVADDEQLLADTVANGLRKLFMAVDVVYDGDSASERLSVNRYDVAVLDRDMPGRTGDEVCRELAGSADGTRILMLTAAAGIRDRIDGLGLGADDYLTKPFAFAELAARVQALARRSGPPLPPVLEQAGIVLDSTRHTVTRGDAALALSAKEFAVLHVLMRAGGRVVSTDELLEQAWDEHADPLTNTVRMTVMTLRRKLGEPSAIHTVRRVGYRLGS